MDCILLLIVKVMENPFVLYQRLLATLRPIYEKGEAQAVALSVLEDAFGWSRTEVYIGKSKPFSLHQQRTFQQILKRLAEGEPVQYVLGHTRFAGRNFTVRQGVLIPRPETEELVRWMAKDLQDLEAPRIVDCGTGSGCIAISLRLMLPKARVEAWDISEEALTIARENARNLGAELIFAQKDMATLVQETHRFDFVISNPPYVLESERKGMSAHVLHHEPGKALFVSDADPLIHYRHLAASRLPLYLEINAAQADATLQMLQQYGYTDLELRRDQFDRPRMIRAQL